ncbi:RagB/SusD family nutrient uptake outer membrane protein [Chitinophaga deserti]|uniref:RagB/SusD family nutrient uptake outer membrane protein n=1 Tax=Chitinophaga deserti TaxID=2164099 RepID=UPI000D6AD38B|nr:RagB/SusD family nutrient uptake outer membrane protein [Chitinophaga deserti]
MKITSITKRFIWLLLPSLFACNKNFLDRKPSDKITEAEVFRNIENAEKFVNVIYQSLPGLFQPGGAWILGSATDETNQSIDATATSPDAGSFNTSSMSPMAFPMQGLWAEYYGKIRSCNTFLANYNNIPNDPNYPQRKARMRGEVLLLRGFYYFQLVIRWGDVPLLTQVQNPFDNPEDIYYKRNSIQEVVQAIVNDLNEAATLLPAGYTDRPNNWGRGSKTIALALKGRLLLYNASPLFNPGNVTSRWAQAAEACRAALDTALNNGYILNPQYNDAFTQYFSREVIWSRPAPGAYRDGGIDQEMNPRGASGYGNITPLQELVDDYEMKKTGLPITDPASEYNPQRPYDGRDPRFAFTILYPGAMWKGRQLDPNGADAPRPGQIVSNYWPRKYLLENVNLFNLTGATDRKWVLIRLAELYLNYAEAQNEAGGSATEVNAAINAVRGRVNMPEYLGGTQEQTRAKIRNERRVELALEGHRFWDVRRWKIAEIVDNRDVHGVKVIGQGNVTYEYPVVEKRTFNKNKDRDYWLPIPQNEIDKVAGRNDQFRQNQGW